MARVIREDARAPIMVWARAIDDATLRLLRDVARRPWVVSHVAAMADAHASDGVAVGTVFATRDALVPGALGGDLGCGMSATRTALDARDLDAGALAAIVSALDRAIPSGDASHAAPVPTPEALMAPSLSTHALTRARDALVPRQLGTLGGGNHFVELDRDPEHRVWLLVHSGSRGLGGAIAAHHLAAASASNGAAGDRLAALDAGAPTGAAYLGDHDLAVAFARANRAALAARALEAIAGVLGAAPEPDPSIDVHHNHVAREPWRGEPLWVHRKGAVAAPRGALALVPGSMGTSSAIVEGLGAEDSFASCSHGAGRVRTRGEARRRIRPRDLEREMRRVAFPRHRARALVEEAPSAYRDLGEVLDDQRDLVRRRVRLEPLAVLKG